MKEKIERYISLLDERIDTSLKMLKDNLEKARAGEISQENGLIEYMSIVSHRCTLIDVKNSLMDMLQE